MLYQKYIPSAWREGRAVIRRRMKTLIMMLWGRAGVQQGYRRRPEVEVQRLSEVKVQRLSEVEIQGRRPRQFSLCFCCTCHAFWFIWYQELGPSWKKSTINNLYRRKKAVDYCAARKQLSLKCIGRQIKMNKPSPILSMKESLSENVLFESWPLM